MMELMNISHVELHFLYFDDIILLYLQIKLKVAVIL